jgi:sRNA-binding protein
MAIAVIESQAMFRRVCRGLAVHAALAALASGIAGCGPITYVGDVTRRATDAVAQARAAQAEKYAPYWWTRATEYLHKAREVAGHADFQGANRFGRLAAEAANHAAEDARIAAKDPASRPREAAPDVAPAKDAPPSRVAPAKGARPPRLAPAKDPP